MNPERPDTAAILGTLKDFQRATVDYVFERLYGADGAHRFLIADEVGLGKTMVARGLIARVIDHLWAESKQINIVYICSNADIARQNINRLNITDKPDFALATRITLLPITVGSLREKPINFVSFTPSTAFDMRVGMGRGEERALLYWMLDAAWSVHTTLGMISLLAGTMDPQRFEQEVHALRTDPKRSINADLCTTFTAVLTDRSTTEQAQGKETLVQRLKRLCDVYAAAPTVADVPLAQRRERRDLIAELRTLLASTCLDALAPDLIILDEFQRFKHLLDPHNPISDMAQRLFNYTRGDYHARVVLLSATPYKMYTTGDEGHEDNHYRDFLETTNFLAPDSSDNVKRLIDAYRSELLRYDGANDHGLLTTKHELETWLRRVMVRTERLTADASRHGMLCEHSSDQVALQPHDLHTYLGLQQIARWVGERDTLEYWKAAPYLISFMDRYRLKQRFTEALKADDAAELAEVVRHTPGLALPWQHIATYSEIDPGNARLRDLLAQVTDVGSWQLLWIPPSLPYYQLGGAFAEPAIARFTKRLIFSHWRMVPRVIASLVSYEAERWIAQWLGEDIENTAEARRRRRGLLQFPRPDRQSLPGMQALGLLYPSPTLVRQGDPLRHAIKHGAAALPTEEQMIEHVKQQLTPLLKPIIARYASAGPPDERWYWAAPILLDMQQDPKGTAQWFEQTDLARIWAGHEDLRDTEEQENSGWAAHIEQARRLVIHRLDLGSPPADLERVIAQHALGGPGVVALRALDRRAGQSLLTTTSLRNSAASIAWGFRGLFNHPEVVALVRGSMSVDSGRHDDPYWRKVVRYAIQGGLQAVLDEYVHVLRESLGLPERWTEQHATEIAQAMVDVLRLRTTTLQVDEIALDAEPIRLTQRRLRCHFAMRFDDEPGEDGGAGLRAEQVRQAFNSPFWPFVLATTSVGQEGLDFHTYCHAIVHWNLPANPVDFEQREGRVHRYKGHAVRKNVAQRVGLPAVIHLSSDPWADLFTKARRDRPRGAIDLIPFWIYQGEATIDRYVPALPLSYDYQRLVALRRSLALYRMVFGQARQEDMLTYLSEHLTEEQLRSIIEKLHINLEPTDKRVG